MSGSGISNGIVIRAWQPITTLVDPSHNLFIRIIINTLRTSISSKLSDIKIELLYRLY